MSDVIEIIVRTFKARGTESYGKECVTQFEHALQTAQLATKAQAGDALIAAALLHDIGHILDVGALPKDCNENLDDRHETRAYDWLVEHFGAEVADPVRLHVPAKRYLCAVDPDYVNTLSPTSHKSYLDQGGPMPAEELKQFDAEPHGEAALRLRRWDDAAKVAGKATPSVKDFVPQLLAVLKTNSTDEHF